MDNLYSRFQPLEQARWNQSNIDTLFHAGCQSYVNRHFGFNGPVNGTPQFYFNLVQQPCNMITGYQRQHRKNITYQAAQGTDSETTDQYTSLIIHNNNTEGVNEQFSKSCELATVAGMNLLQPYLDYMGDDPAQGQLKVKIWEYNSFLIDPYFRNPDMSDAQFIWCQEYISKFEAERRFPDKINDVRPMSGTPQRYGNFYFLPENQNMARNDLMVLSYIWYRWKRKKKRLYSKKMNLFFDYAGGDQNLEAIQYNIPDLQPVNVEVPTWKCAVVLNDQMMYQGNNPLGFDECPMVANFWNYSPHINYPDLRDRSLVRCMRDSNFLFNYKVLQNNDIASATINAGWKRKVGAVANEDNLKKAGQGWDVIINEGYELQDCEKIIPSAVPESDLALAQQMAELVFQVSGLNMENWAGQQDKQISTLTMMMKQAANLMVFQKYFDQWDYALKLLGDLELKIVLNNWNAEKVKLLIGEEPTPYFYSKIFAKYKVMVEEGVETVTQQNMQAQQMLEINDRFGREVIPPSMIIKDMNIQGKSKILKFLEEQEKQASAVQEEAQTIQHAFEEAKLKELYSKAVSNLATARERQGRSESNIGLFEERLSMIGRNRALATKDKMEALQKLLESVEKYGELDTFFKEKQIDMMDTEQMQIEDREKIDAKSTAESNKFLEQIMGGMLQPQGMMNQGQQAPQMNENQMPEMAQMM